MENSTKIMDDKEEEINNVDDIITSQRNAVVKRTWPDRTLVYEFNENVDSTTRQIIRNGVSLLKDSLGHCINFKESDHGERVLVSKHEDYCQASVGYYGLDTQILDLATWCYIKGWPRKVFYGSIQHEFLHALGLFHEQSRDDRDSYVNIHEENIQPKKIHNFNTCSQRGEKCSTFGEPYDYSSVMHYPKDAASIGTSLTITAKNPINNENGPKSWAHSWRCEACTVFVRLSSCHTI